MTPGGDAVGTTGMVGQSERTFATEEEISGARGSGRVHDWSGARQPGANVLDGSSDGSTADQKPGNNADRRASDSSDHTWNSWAGSGWHGGWNGWWNGYGDWGRNWQGYQGPSDIRQGWPDSRAWSIDPSSRQSTMSPGPTIATSGEPTAPPTTNPGHSSITPPSTGPTTGSGTMSTIHGGMIDGMGGFGRPREEALEGRPAGAPSEKIMVPVFRGDAEGGELGSSARSTYARWRPGRG